MIHLLINEDLLSFFYKHVCKLKLLSFCSLLLHFSPFDHIIIDVQYNLFVIAMQCTLLQLCLLQEIQNGILLFFVHVSLLTLKSGNKTSMRHHRFCKRNRVTQEWLPWLFRGHGRNTTVAVTQDTSLLLSFGTAFILHSYSHYWVKSIFEGKIDKLLTPFLQRSSFLQHFFTRVA